MKKRYIIAFLILVAALAACNKFWLIFKSAHSAHFDFYTFCIILILSYLGGLKLTQYLADFKNLKHQSRIEIIFLAVFFTLLFIPMSRINQENISYAENRELATYKPFINKNSEINYDFGENYDKYFNDRFNLRKQLLHLNRYFVYILSDKIVKLSNGFVNKENHLIASAWLIDNYSNAELERNFNVLKDFKKFCDENNIRLYTIIVPQKEFIHPISDNIQRKDINLTSNIKNNNLNIIYPAGIFLEQAKLKPLYFKTEHHWTDTGTYLGYTELMKQIQNDIPDLKSLNLNDFDIKTNKKVNADWSNTFGNGQTCSFLGLPNHLCKKSLNVEYDYFYFKEQGEVIKLSEIVKSKDRSREYFYKQGYDKRVIILGTSMGENLTKFIAPTFKHTLRIRINNVPDIKWPDDFKIMKYYKTKILDYKPDIIIFCITYQNIRDLHKIFED